MITASVMKELIALKALIEVVFETFSLAAWQNPFTHKKVKFRQTNKLNNDKEIKMQKGETIHYSKKQKSICLIIHIDLVIVLITITLTTLIFHKFFSSVWERFIFGEKLFLYLEKTFLQIKLYTNLGKQKILTFFISLT